jgi:phosphate transport system ATP-binding protein
MTSSLDYDERSSSGQPLFAAGQSSPKMRVERFNLHYGNFQALKDVNLSVEEHKITALIGPSGCGKSTLLRAMNRMNDLIRSVRVEGGVLLDGEDIYGPGVDVCALRKRVGMVFQRPNPFPLSIYDNVAFGLRVEGRFGRRRVEGRPAKPSRMGRKDSERVREVVERSLKAAWLWDQLKDKLGESALELPLDQQQRLCIARLAAVEPDVILMDEPCSSLDPIATAKVEELMLELKRDYTIAVVTHNMQQAARISDYSGYMLLGEMVEFGPTGELFVKPKDKRTDDYISGRYG